MKNVDIQIIFIDFGLQENIIKINFRCLNEVKMFLSVPRFIHV